MIFLAHVLCGAKLASFSPKADGVLIKLQRCHVSTFFQLLRSDTSMRATVTVSGKFVSFLRCSLLATQRHVDLQGATLTGSLMTKLWQQNMRFFSWPKGSVVVFLTELFIFVSIG